jgi:DNA polymerase-3 subunit gamma/tau
VFVLATTDPKKVLPTIRSRTQHYEFRLLGADVLASLLADVNAAAGLGVAGEAIDLVVRRGKGSARDALSALDQVAASGGAEDEAPVTEELVEALCERDSVRALVAVAEGCVAGRDARGLAGDLLDQLRSAFLATMAPGLLDIPDTGREHLIAQAHRLGPAALVRAMEAVGQAQIDMREALNPRICLETALVRLTRADTDASPAALLERIERLERGLAGPVTEPARAEARQAVASSSRSDAAPVPPHAAAAARATLGALRQRSAPSPGQGGGSSPERQPAVPPPGPGPRPSGASASASAQPEASAGDAAIPSRDELTKAWGDAVLRSLSGRSKARFGAGRFTAVERGMAVFALPTEHYLGRCEEVRADVEAALAAHFGVRVPLRLTVERGPAVSAGLPSGGDDELIDLEDVGEAAPAVASPVDRLRQAFPGAEEVQP